MTSEREGQGRGLRFDIRARLLVSLAVSGVGLYLNDPGPLVALGGASFLYALTTKRFKLLALAYGLVAVMSVMSIVMIYLFYQGIEMLLVHMESPHARMAAGMKVSLIENFHIPFLRLIPSINVLLAIVLDFHVQSFIAAMKSVRLPRILFLPLTVFCRFLPEFFIHVRQLRDAIRLRGFRLSPVLACTRPLLAMRLTVVPLSIRALRMADNLAMSAEMKRIGYSTRPTLWKPSIWHRRDLVLLGLAASILVAVVLWQMHIPEAPVMGGMRP